MNKKKVTRFIVGFLVYSALYFGVSYLFNLSGMCFEDLRDWNCLKISLAQTVFFGFFMMLFDYFVLKKFIGKKDVDKQ